MGIIEGELDGGVEGLTVGMKLDFVLGELVGALDGTVDGINVGINCSTLLLVVETPVLSDVPLADPEFVIVAAVEGIVQFMVLEHIDCKLLVIFPVFITEIKSTPMLLPTLNKYC